MNRTNVILGAIIALLLIGGIGYYASQNSTPPADNATSTPPTATPGTPDNSNPTNPIPTSNPQPGSPLVPTNPSALPSDNAAILNGTVVPNGAFTNYWYEYSLASSLSNKVSSRSQTIGSGYTSIPAPAYITGLTKDTTYYFRLVAENQYGKTFGTQYSFLTTHGVPAPVGSIPAAKTLAATLISNTASKLNGEVTPNQASTGYWFEYGKTTNLGSATTLVSVGNATIKLQVASPLANLDPQTTYYFRLNAQNQFGTVNGAILNFKTTGSVPATAATPTVATRNATNLSSSGATLHGTVNSNSSDTAYWFEYSTDSAFGTAVRSTNQQPISAGSNTTSIQASLTGLSSKTNYYFRLVAQNGIGTTRGQNIMFKTR